MKAKILLAAILLLPASALADGKALFKSKCAGCHGSNGEGKAALKTYDLGLPATQGQTDAQIKGSIENGKKVTGNMPAYKSKLTDAEIDSLVKYIRTLKK